MVRRDGCPRPTWRRLAASAPGSVTFVRTSGSRVPAASMGSPSHDGSHNPGWPLCAWLPLGSQVPTVAPCPRPRLLALPSVCGPGLDSAVGASKGSPCPHAPWCPHLRAEGKSCTLPVPLAGARACGRHSGADGSGTCMTVEPSPSPSQPEPSGCWCWCWCWCCDFSVNKLLCLCWESAARPRHPQLQISRSLAASPGIAFVQNSQLGEDPGGRGAVCQLDCFLLQVTKRLVQAG